MAAFGVSEALTILMETAGKSAIARGPHTDSIRGALRLWASKRSSSSNSRIVIRFRTSLKGSCSSRIVEVCCLNGIRMNSSPRIYIAIVDDDDGVCRSMSRLLRAAQFQAITYASAEAFLSDTKHPKFDCLVLDIQLEGMSGLELRKRLAAVKDRTPVIFITAHNDPEVRAEAEAYECAGFFRKTDSGTDILASIRRATGLSETNDPS